MTGPEEGPWDSAPRAALAVLLARYPQLVFRDDDAPSELPALDEARSDHLRARAERWS